MLRFRLPVHRPKLTRLVPGELTRYNTRKSEIVLRWGTEDDGRTLWLREHLDYEDGAFEERLCGYLPLVELPDPPDVKGLGDLERALRTRFDAHPLANQLPGVVELVERVLPDSDPLEAARACARNACTAGVARAFAFALGGGSGGPFRSGIEPVELRRLARACLVMQLTDLSCHLGSSPSEYWARELLDELPVYPAGKHALHDGGNHDEVCLEYDRLLVAYLREARSAVDRALALPPEKLDARSQQLSLPSAVFTSEEAIAQVTGAIADSSLYLKLETEELHGQPLSEIAPLLAKLLSGCPPVPPREASLVDDLATGYEILRLLDAVAWSDLDLAAEIRAAAEKRAKDEAESAARLEAIRLEHRAGSAKGGRALPLVVLALALVVLAFLLRACAS